MHTGFLQIFLGNSWNTLFWNSGLGQLYKMANVLYTYYVESSEGILKQPKIIASFESTQWLTNQSQVRIISDNLIFKPQLSAAIEVLPQHPRGTSKLASTPSTHPSSMRIQIPLR